MEKHRARIAVKSLERTCAAMFDISPRVCMRREIHVRDFILHLRSIVSTFVLRTSFCVSPERKQRRWQAGDIREKDSSILRITYAIREIPTRRREHDREDR